MLTTARFQRRALHSANKDLYVVKRKKNSVSHLRSSGVSMRTQVPGSAAGREVRRGVATCSCTATLLQLGLENSHDASTLGKILQRLGELPALEGRPQPCEAIEGLLANRKAGWTAVLSSLSLMALHRSGAEASLRRKVWEALPKRVVRAPEVLAAAMNCASADPRWATELWSIAVEEGLGTTYSAIKSPYLLSMARSGSWDAVWSVGINQHVVAGLSHISILQNSPLAGWRVWRTARQLKYTLASCDVTALLQFLVAFGTPKDLAWGYRESLRHDVVTDARLLLCQASVSAFLYATTGDAQWQNRFAQHAAAMRKVEPHLQLVNWETVRMHNLSAAMCAASYAVSQRGPQPALSNMVAKAIGRPVEQPADLVVDRLRQVFEA
ncbi:hypothetical protein DIPPA_11900 [Diplonema papillatum]|nr:hypothetical protein DIPPA_11900 [Diplonema papillatum]